MLDKTVASHVLGLQLDNHLLTGAALSLARRKLKVDSLFSIQLENGDTGTDNVKPLYIRSPDQEFESLKASYLVASNIAANDVLVRPLDLKLKKEKDIDATLSFQAEPILPYPVENAILDRIILEKDKEGTKLTVMAVRKDHLSKNLETWNQLGIEPEVLTAPSQALTNFATTFTDIQSPLYILHIGLNSSLCLLSDAGKVIAAQAFEGGISPILARTERESEFDEAAALKEMYNKDIATLTSSNNEVKQAVDALKIEVTRTIYALNKQTKGRDVKDILVTGPGAVIDGLSDVLCQSFGKNLLAIPDEKLPGISLKDLLSFALPIGAALGALPNTPDQINFRQQEFAYPEPWKRLKEPLILYFLLSVGLAAALYIFGNAYANYKQSELKQNYLNLLEVMNKPYTSFENDFLSKTKGNKSIEEGLTSVADLTNDDIELRLNLLEKEIQAAPQIFPLQPNVPLVSDVLAWISTHPNFVGIKESEEKQGQSLQLENFSYTMVKRPEPTKKQEKYQVKVEIEFSSATPKMAREFHDALIAPNDIVDPKSEIKWTTNRDKYKTSFFLKDRTQYTTQ